MHFPKRIQFQLLETARIIRTMTGAWMGEAIVCKASEGSDNHLSKTLVSSITWLRVICFLPVSFSIFLQRIQLLPSELWTLKEQHFFSAESTFRTWAKAVWPCPYQESISTTQCSLHSIHSQVWQGAVTVSIDSATRGSITSIRESLLIIYFVKINTMALIL